MRRTVGTIAERMLRDETPEFFDDFWSKLERRERVAARRWRRAAFGLAAVAIAALATAGVVADPSSSCACTAMRRARSTSIRGRCQKPMSVVSQAGEM